MRGILSARDARGIATSDLLKVLHQIEDVAYKGGLEITLKTKLKETIIGILTDYGYKIDYEQVPIYEETPYGVRYKIIGYTDQTIISWYENPNNT